MPGQDIFSLQNMNRFFSHLHFCLPDGFFSVKQTQEFALFLTCFTVLQQDDENTAVSKHTGNKNTMQYYLKEELSKSWCQSLLDAE